MKTLILGCGSIGKKHALNLKKLRKSQIILCDNNENRLKTLGKIIHPLKQYVDYKKAIQENMDISHAIICTPSSYHVKPAIYLFKNKINVLIEKPISDSLFQTKSLLNLCKKNNLVGMMGHSFIFDANYKKLKSLISTKNMGKIYSVNFILKQYLPDWHPDINYKKEYTARKELGGGALLTLGSHIFYLVEWLFGNLEQSFTSFKTTQGSLKINVDDSFYFLGKTKKDIVIQINSNFISRKYSHNISIDCEKGTIELDFLKNKIKIIAPNNKSKIIKIKHPHDRYYSEIKYFLNLKKSDKIEENVSLQSGIRFLQQVKKIPRL